MAYINSGKRREVMAMKFFWSVVEASKWALEYSGSMKACGNGRFMVEWKL
jgi:hypothetical protein